MQGIRASLLLFVVSAGLAWGQTTPAATATAAREWTSSDGKKITAVYLGVEGANVALRLPTGKVLLIPATRFSAEDNAFVRAHQFDYHAAWATWTNDSRRTMQSVVVQEDKEDGARLKAFVYKTPHFRFISEVNLGTALVKDLARVFELTYNLHTVSPLNKVTRPDGQLFDAKLYGSLASYHAAGGPEKTAGVYLLKERAFLAPLDLMGVREADAGWRIDFNSYDTSTIVHELTHMFTHDMLNNLPLWVNEGYAEYISHIPIERDAFMTGTDKIRDGAIDAMIKYEDALHPDSKPHAGVLSKADRITFIKSGRIPKLFKVQDVLTMNNTTWTRGNANPPPVPAPTPGSATPFGVRPSPSAQDANRLPKLYHTAHLILYYFIQIEGEKGVTKLRRFLEKNQRSMAGYLQYQEDFDSYKTRMDAFLELPGVVKLDGGKFRYPTNLTPPKPPTAPFTDPDVLMMGGLDALLEGESANVVGARIQAALVKDLGMKLQFD